MLSSLKTIINRTFEMKIFLNRIIHLALLITLCSCLGIGGEEEEAGTSSKSKNSAGSSSSEGSFESATCEDIIEYLDDSMLETWCDASEPYAVYAGASADPATSSCHGTNFSVDSAIIVFALGLQDLEINKTTEEVRGDFYIGMYAESGASTELGFSTMECSFGGSANADDPLSIHTVGNFSCYFDGGIEETEYGEVFSRAQDLDCDASSFGLESYNYKAAVVVKFYSLYESLFEYLYY